MHSGGALITVMKFADLRDRNDALVFFAKTSAGGKWLICRL